jgi:hypothetical protein
MYAGFATKIAASGSAVAVYVPAAHCALAREMQKITNKTRTIRMPHTPRAFIHTDSKMGFGLFVFLLMKETSRLA